VVEGVVHSLQSSVHSRTARDGREVSPSYDRARLGTTHVELQEVEGAPRRAGIYPGCKARNSLEADWWATACENGSCGKPSD